MRTLLIFQLRLLLYGIQLWVKATVVWATGFWHWSYAVTSAQYWEVHIGTVKPLSDECNYMTSVMQLHCVDLHIWEGGQYVLHYDNLLL